LKMSQSKTTEQIPEYKLITHLFDKQPDAVIWFVPKFDENDPNVPVDFLVGYCNAAVCVLLKVTKHELTGSSLLSSSLIDDQSRKQVLEQCIQIWKTGAHNEFTYYSPMAQKYFCVQRSKLQNGILSITRDHTQFVLEHQEKELQANLLNQIIESSTSGISVYEAIRDKSGKLLDFKLKLANQKSAEITAFTLEELYKYTTKELMIIRGQSNLFEVIKKVVETGEPVYTEYFSPAREQWVAFSIKKFNDGYLLNYIDITHTKNLEKKAQDQAEMLSGILNASPTGLITLEAVYSPSGKIEDFKVVLLNAAAEKILSIKEEDKSKTYLSLFPNAKKNGFFELHRNALTTGVAVSKEFFYKDDGYNGWYYLSVAKMNNNTLVQSFSDITHTRENKS
jgi:PAS domain-containing protein